MGHLNGRNTASFDLAYGDGGACSCACHTNPYTPCSVPGGCGSEGCTRQSRTTAVGVCATPNRPDGTPACRGYNHATNQPATVPPVDAFCNPCLDHYTRVPALLVYDYLDLEQLHLPALSQALDTRRTGRDGPPIPLAVAAEALQAEIHHTLTTWERVVRAACQLSKPAGPVRAGHAVARAARILEPRMRILANHPATLVPLTGCEDPPEPVTGADAVLHLARLHQRARAMLGRTRRIYWTPGECWQAACAETHRQAVAAGRHQPDEWLYKSEPRWERDQQPVYCRYCGESRSEAEYTAYVRMLVWPQQHPTEAAA